VFTSLLMVRSVRESVHRKESYTGGVINQKDGMMTLTGTTALRTLRNLTLQGITSGAGVNVLRMGRVTSGVNTGLNQMDIITMERLINGTTAALGYPKSTLQPRHCRDKTVQEYVTYTAPATNGAPCLLLSQRTGGTGVGLRRTKTQL